MTNENEPAPSLSPQGKIDIAPLAIATIAAHATVRSYGIVGMAAKNIMEGISATVTRDPHKGISVRLGSDSIQIDLYVIVEYGTRISSVARSVANTVKFSVEKATSLPVSEVNVFVQGLRISSTD